MLLRPVQTHPCISQTWLPSRAWQTSPCHEGLVNRCQLAPSDLGGDGKISKGSEIVVNKLGCGLVPPDFELILQYNPLMHLMPLGHVEK